MIKVFNILFNNFIPLVFGLAGIVLAYYQIKYLIEGIIFASWSVHAIAVIFGMVLIFFATKIVYENETPKTKKTSIGNNIFGIKVSLLITVGITFIVFLFAKQFQEKITEKDIVGIWITKEYKHHGNHGIIDGLTESAMRQGVYAFNKNNSYQYRNDNLSDFPKYNLSVSYLDKFVIRNTASWTLNSYERKIIISERSYDTPTLLEDISNEKTIKKKSRDLIYAIEYIDGDEMKLRHKKYSIVLKRVH